MPTALSTISDAAAVQTRPTVSVDTHFHVFEAGQAQPGARYTPGYTAALGIWQAQVQPTGITHGVLVQTSFMGTDNRLLLAHLAAHRQTLRGIAVVSPDITAPQLAAMHTQGVRGIRLNLAGQAHELSAWSRAQGVWDALLRLGWHVELHTDNGRLPEVLSALPLALPLVLDHFARPASVSLHDPTVVAVRARRKSGGAAVHVKLSAPYRLATGVCLTALCQLWHDELGLEALLWGSDWPFTNHEASQNYPQQFNGLATWLAGDAVALQAVLSSNPARLYGFETGETAPMQNAP